MCQHVSAALHLRCKPKATCYPKHPIKVNPTMVNPIKVNPITVNAITVNPITVNCTYYAHPWA